MDSSSDTVEEDAGESHLAEGDGVAHVSVGTEDCDRHEVVENTASDIKHLLAKQGRVTDLKLLLKRLNDRVDKLGLPSVKLD